MPLASSGYDEYFLGSIVTFKNSNDQLEVIDGQQRLTTIMLLFRAFYDSFRRANDDNSKKIRNDLGRCIRKTDEFGNLLLDQLKIDSEVATDNDKEEFINILRTGEVDAKSRSRYAANYRFFVRQVGEFQKYNTPSFMYLPRRIMDNCILLPIEAESQDTALRIFSTLNDRGLPLSDADIFKAQFYKFYNDLGGKAAKDKFIDKWKELESIVNPIFHPYNGTPMDDLFTRYMYYLRAKEGNKETTTESLRRFYSRNKFKYLHQEQTIIDMESLANFWKDIAEQNPSRFSAGILKLLFVLNYAPNGLWQYLTSVYYLTNKNGNDRLDDSEFYDFLSRLIGFIWVYAVVNPGVNALRTPAYAEMANM